MLHPKVHLLVCKETLGSQIVVFVTVPSNREYWYNVITKDITVNGQKVDKSHPAYRDTATAMYKALHPTSDIRSHIKDNF